nr:hypothetical protein [Tanacetum cinerariifolium]
ETEIPQPLPIAPSPVSPSDDPYLIVRQAHTPATIDTESELEEAPLEMEEFQPLAARTEPPSSGHALISSDSTPVSPLTDEEFEASKPSDTRITSSHSTNPSDSTTPLSPDHPLAQTSPALTRVSYYRSTAHTEREGSEDEGPSLGEEEKAAPEGQHQVVPVVGIAVDEPLGLGYRALRCRELAFGEGSETPATRPSVHATWVDLVDGTVYTDILIDVPPIRVPVQTPPSPEWSFGSLPVSLSSPAVPTLVASPSTTPTATIAVGEDEFLEVGAQLKLYGSILHDHTQRLDTLPPALFKGYDRDIRELYTRPVLALDSWARHVDAQRAEMWNIHHPKIPTEKVCMTNSIQEEESFNLLEIGDDLFSYELPMCLKFEQNTKLCDNEKVDTHGSFNNLQELEVKHRDIPTCDLNLRFCDEGEAIYRKGVHRMLEQWMCFWDHERRIVKGNCIKFVDFLQVRYGNQKIDDITLERRYYEWVAQNCEFDDDGTPSRTTTPNDPYRLILNEWVLDSFDVEAEYAKKFDDPYSRRFDEYKQVFNNEVEQLSNEYVLRIRKKGYFLDDA